MNIEKLISKLKTSAVISLILGLLALTWVILDYFIIIDLIVEYKIKLSIYILLLALSGVAFAFFILFAFITIYYIFRTSIKYHSEKKKSASLNNNVNDTSVDNS
ncbi:hypothetical protein ACFLTH_15640 [Bacteroidota bacterium]